MKAAERTKEYRSLFSWRSDWRSAEEPNKGFDAAFGDILRYVRGRLAQEGIASRTDDAVTTKYIGQINALEMA